MHSPFHIILINILQWKITGSNACVSIFKCYRENFIHVHLPRFPDVPLMSQRIQLPTLVVF